MAFCDECGTELKDGAFFCKKCGAKTVAGGSAPVQAAPPPVARAKKKGKGCLIFFILLVAAALWFFRDSIRNAKIFRSEAAVLREVIGKSAGRKASGKAAVSAASANFRDGPSGDAKILKTLKKGDSLTVTGDTSGGWTPVEHDGVAGFVSADLIIMEEP